MKKLAIGLMLLLLCVGATSIGNADEILLPIISVEPDPYDFGQVPLYSIARGTLIVSNSGETPLIVESVKTRAPFSDGATSFTVPPGGSRKVMISFQPTSVGVVSGPCTFISNAANEPTLTVTLTGEGVAQ
jgi:hypothetical protein